MPGYWPASICFFSPSPLGPPAMLTNVGTQSREANISFLTVPGLITPGQRITIGARMPPSQVVSFPPLKGVVPPSGKVMVSAPLSVVKTTMVLLVCPKSSIFLSTRPMLSSICFMPASLTPQSLPPGSPTIAIYLSDSTVVMCMRAGLYQIKKGLPVFLGSLRSTQSLTCEEISSSTVFERSSVSGPSSVPIWFFAVPSGDFIQSTGLRRCQAQAGLGVDGTGNLWNSRDWFLLARRSNALLGRGLVDVGEAHALHRVEVVEVAPELLEP